MPTPDPHRFDHLVVLMLENRSFDNLCGYLYENEQPKHFIPDTDRVLRGVAGRDGLVNDGGGAAYREPHARLRAGLHPGRGGLEEVGRRH